MKSSLALIIVLGVSLPVTQIHAVTSPSPFASTTSQQALNQSSTDDINGQLAISSHTPSSGNLSTLTDAATPSSPSDNVVVGPGTATVSLSWDLGAIVDPTLRRLDTVSIWLAQGSQGFNGSLATSLDGNSYTAIANSGHNVPLDAVGSVRGGVATTFHHILYDFTGTNVSNFRYVQLNTSGYITVLGEDGIQPLFVEVDMTTSVPEPSTVALLAIGAGIVGFSLRKNRKNAA